MGTPNDARMASNWTTAAGALEGILHYLGMPLPRYAIMGLTGHAWHACLGRREDVVALPSGPVSLDWEAMVERYARTGVRWERFGGELPPGESTDEIRQAAVEWAIARLDAGRPLIGWDFHLHEFGVVFDYSRAEKAFYVDSVLREEVGPIAHWRDWPSEATRRIELFAPAEAFEPDPLETVIAALETAIAFLSGETGMDDEDVRGTAALEAWADALDGSTEVDRPGNAYNLAVLQAARLDGADFLASLAENIPELAEEIGAAERAIRDETKALAPLLTLFPFPTGGHGNVQNPGLREAAANALRKAAQHERTAQERLETVLAELRA